MFGTFICKKCNHKITIDFSSPKMNSCFCSNCGVKFSNSHYIDSFYDKFLNLERALHDLQFCCLSSGKSDPVYNSDIENLNELYINSSKEVRQVLSGIIDINFLMIFDAVKDEDLETLREYQSKLRMIWSEKINLKQDNMKKFLEVSED